MGDWSKWRPATIEGAVVGHFVRHRRAVTRVLTPYHAGDLRHPNRLDCASENKDFWLQVGVNFFEVGVCFVQSTGTSDSWFVNLECCDAKGKASTTSEYFTLRRLG